jgi:N-acetylmuramoyl-L-alanine amidase
MIVAMVFHTTIAALSANPENLDNDCPATTVAIDIGHSMKRPGTRSARGVPEFAFNQQQAEAIVRISRIKFPNIDALIINRSGQNISLGQRVVKAQKAGARIFVSVHHDSAQKRYLEPWLFKGKNLDHTPSISGFSIFISPGEQGRNSHQLARAIAVKFLSAGRKPSAHHAENIPGERRLFLNRAQGIYAAPFSVLIRSSIPAVLVEFGVIRNKREETELASPSGRNALATAALEGIKLFCHDNSADCGC